MLDIERIRQLVDMMVANDLVELSLRDGEVEVNLRRPNPNTGVAGVTAVGHPPVLNPGAEPGATVSSPQMPAKEEETDELAEIRSPMVGTFYVAPDPDSPPFVQVGGHVSPDTVVCIVEAMKVFNEIKAEVAGTIERILVKNEKPIEYGQPLFLVRSE